MNAPFTVFAVPINPGDDPKKIGVDFKKRNGFLFRGKASLYGKIFVKDGEGEEKQYKLMILKNKFYDPNEDNPKYDSDTTEAEDGIEF